MARCLNSDTGGFGEAAMGQGNGADCFADQALGFGEDCRSMRMLAVEEGLRDISRGIDGNCSGLYNLAHCSYRQGVCRCRQGAELCEEGVCQVLEGLREVSFGELSDAGRVEKGLREVRCGDRLVLEGTEHIRCCRTALGLAEINRGILLEKIGLRDIVRGLREPCNDVCGDLYPLSRGCRGADIPCGL